jgi:hypothetical protein
MSLVPEQKYALTDTLYFRKNGLITSGKFKFVKMDKDYVRGEDGTLIFEKYNTPHYWISGEWYKESELKLSAEDLLL